LENNFRNSWKGPNQFSHKLALEHIKNNKPVNCKIINDILAYCNITINDEILENLINSPRLIINNLNKEDSKKIIKDNLGLPSNKIQIPGVYIFTLKNTGQKYVGSSSQLAVRLSCYLNKKYKTIGKFIPLPLAFAFRFYPLAAALMPSSCLCKSNPCPRTAGPLEGGQRLK
jgi:hypothetical protein